MFIISQYCFVYWENDTMMGIFRWRRMGRLWMLLRWVLRWGIRFTWMAWLFWYLLLLCICFLMFIFIVFRINYNILVFIFMFTFIFMLILCLTLLMMMINVIMARIYNAVTTSPFPKLVLLSLLSTLLTLWLCLLHFIDH